jgi:hypothetical protein
LFLNTDKVDIHSKDTEGEKPLDRVSWWNDGAILKLLRDEETKIVRKVAQREVINESTARDAAFSQL